MRITNNITKWNYLATCKLFLHYLFGSGEPLHVEVEKPKGVLPKYSAQYLSLGHFNYDNGVDLYDFNEGEGWGILCDIGTPYFIYWNVE